MFVLLYLKLKLNYEQNHPNMLINGDNEWNIMFLFNIKKLSFQITNFLFYIVNFINQKNNMIISQISNY